MFALLDLLHMLDNYKPLTPHLFHGVSLSMVIGTFAIVAYKFVDSNFFSLPFIGGMTLFIVAVYATPAIEHITIYFKAFVIRLQTREEKRTIKNKYARDEVLDKFFPVSTSPGDPPEFTIDKGKMETYKDFIKMMEALK